VLAGGASGCFSAKTSRKAGISMYASFNLDKRGNWVCRIKLKE